jgi:hypothetical protein
MGRDPALFPDPLAVKPERWLRTAEMTPRKEDIANYFIQGVDQKCVYTR